MRFTNWLHNDQPSTGVQNASTTEDGTYFINGKTSDSDLQTVSRKTTGATWAVTSEDEWYKAAYYNPASNSYYLYPTRSDTAPGNDMTDVSHNNANIYTDGTNYPIDSGKYTTVGGQFANSTSPYDTFDQGGNVSEWNEAIVYGSNRGLRGGSFYDHDNDLRSAARYDCPATIKIRQ